MPEFQKQFDRYSNDGFTILAVNHSETAEDLAGFREEFGLTFPLAMDEDGTIQNQFSIFSYASTFVIDRKGVILARHFGPLTAQQIEQLLNQALDS
jgi:peroxiredoxin